MAERTPRCRPPIARLCRVLEKENRQFLAERDLEPFEFDVLATLRRSGEPFELTASALVKATLPAAPVAFVLQYSRRRMTLKNLKYRFGTGAGGPTLEDGLAWLADNAFHQTDFNADHGANALGEWSDERVRKVRDLCAQHDIHLGIHTLSAVNVSDFSPYMSAAVDDYLRANIDLGKRLGVERVIVHAGLHQSSELDLRRKASLEHLTRAVQYAESAGVVLLLENLNREPDDAELRYMGFNIEELQTYFEAIPSANFGWAFSANHAHLMPMDYSGFIDALGVKRVGLMLTADNRGTIEEHLVPGAGTFDFAGLYRRLDREGYEGPFMLTFGNRAEKLAGREYLLRQAGVS